MNALCPLLTLAIVLTVGPGMIPAPNGPGSSGNRIRAFPGAEGAGKWTRGGRGGQVITVTNLHDAGPGSLRAAVETRGPRTVIFRVSGTIELSKPLRVGHPYLTIAGQTAPGDGICLKGSEFQIIDTHDVIVRYLRCRPGDQTSQPGDLDAISISSATDVMIDHCSATWSTDECLSVTSDTDRITIQNCLIAEALTKHSYGSIIASYRGSLSFLHNLYACNSSRNPRPGGYQSYPEHKNTPGPRIDFRNNVLFNWTYGPGYTGTSGEIAERITMNYVGNYLKPGRDTQPSDRAKVFTIFKGGVASLYLHGNQFDPPVSPRAPSDLVVVYPGATLDLREKPLAFESPSDAMTASVAYERVLEQVGAMKPTRDAVDAGIVAGVRDGHGRQKRTLDKNAWPVLRSTEALTDSDGDGIPDAWERKHDLNESDAHDASRPHGPDGRTHFEDWLDSL